MSILERIITLCEGTLKKKQVNDSEQGVVVSRQNSPPDERDVEAAEEAADRAIKSGLSSRLGGESESSRASNSRAKKAGSSDY